MLQVYPARRSPQACWRSTIVRGLAVNCDVDAFIQKVEFFQQTGFIKPALEDAATRWYWTQNNRSELRY